MVTPREGVLFFGFYNLVDDPNIDYIMVDYRRRINETQHFR